MKDEGFWKQQGREVPTKETGRMLDVGAQAEKTRTGRECACKVDGFIYMKGKVCPVDKAKVGDQDEILSIPRSKERK